MPAGFGGRLRGKGPHPHRERDLAAQPTLSPLCPPLMLNRQRHSSIVGAGNVRYRTCRSLFRRLVLVPWRRARMVWRRQPMRGCCNQSGLVKPRLRMAHRRRRIGSPIRVCSASPPPGARSGGRDRAGRCRRRRQSGRGEWSWLADEDLVDDGVAMALFLRLDQLEWGVDEDGVVPGERGQLVLVFGWIVVSG